MSFGILAPGTVFAKKAVDHWDYGTLAVLARSILEVRLSFYYLCVQECRRTEWECRWNLFNLHDCTARIRLLQEMGDSSEDVSGFEAEAEELRGRLTQNEFFLALPGGEQRRLLRGKSAYLEPLEVIAAAAGVEAQEFRWLYIFLSNQVHGLPLSFYRIGEAEGGRGRGIYSKVEDDYSCICVSLVISLLKAARDEMEVLFAPHIDG